MKASKIKCSLVALILSLTAIPTNALAESIKGIWMLESNTKSTVISYKVLRKDGKYFNLRSYDGGKTYNVTRKGDYETIAPGIYVENLKYENGVQCNTVFPISYKKNKKKLHLTFILNGHTYTESWVKVPKIISNPKDR